MPWKSKNNTYFGTEGGYKYLIACKVYGAGHDVRWQNRTALWSLLTWRVESSSSISAIHGMQYDCPLSHHMCYATESVRRQKFPYRVTRWTCVDVRRFIWAVISSFGWTIGPDMPAPSNAAMHAHAHISHASSPECPIKEKLRPMIFAGVIRQSRHGKS